MWGSRARYTGQPLPEKPQFYTTVSDAAVEAVEGLQAEAQAVVAALSAAVGLAEPPDIPDVRADLEACYGPAIGDPSTLGSLLRTNTAYKVGCWATAATAAATAATAATAPRTIPQALLPSRAPLMAWPPCPPALPHCRVCTTP